MDAPALALIEKWKRPYGRVSEWEAYDMGSDELGRWFHSPAGSVHRLRDGEAWVVPWDGVQLVPADGWWVAWFWDDPKGRWYAADVCTPPEATETGWKHVDLELDLVGGPMGFERVVDEDDFLESIERGFISTDEMIAARSCEAALESAMRARREPFGTTGWMKLDQAMAMALPPPL